MTKMSCTVAPAVGPCPECGAKRFVDEDGDAACPDCPIPFAPPDLDPMGERFAVVDPPPADPAAVFRIDPADFIHWATRVGVNIAYRYRIPAGTQDEQDLIQAGLLAMCEKAPRFGPEKLLPGDDPHNGFQRWSYAAVVGRCIAEVYRLRSGGTFSVLRGRVAARPTVVALEDLYAEAGEGGVWLRLLPHTDFRASYRGVGPTALRHHRSIGPDRRWSDNPVDPAWTGPGYLYRTPAGNVMAMAYTRDPETGKRLRPTKTFDKVRDAKAWLKQMMKARPAAGT